MAGYYFIVGGQRSSKGLISRSNALKSRRNGTIIDVKIGSWTGFLLKYWRENVLILFIRLFILNITLWNNLLLYVHNSIDGWRKYEKNEDRFIQDEVRQ